MPFQPLSARRLYREIAEQIRGLLASGAYPPGSRLPAERDMAAQLKVSRTSVREALIALEVSGLIDVRGGSGIYVAQPPVTPPIGDVGPGPFELLEARRLVEGEAVAEAALSINDATLAELGELVIKLEQSAHDPDEEENADRQFHLKIAEATGNSVLVQTVRYYWELRTGPMWKRIVEHFHSPQLRAAVVTDHREIVEALRQHSAQGARKAMHRHLRRVATEFAGSLAGEGTEDQTKDPESGEAVAVRPKSAPPGY